MKKLFSSILLVLAMLALLVSCNTPEPEECKHKDEDGDGYCDNCDGFRAEDGSICDCPCHQKSGILSSLYKIVLFIFRLFKIGQKCGCGADHYVVD